MFDFSQAGRQAGRWRIGKEGKSEGGEERGRGTERVREGE